MKRGGPKNTHGDQTSDPEEPGSGQLLNSREGAQGSAHDLSLSPRFVSLIPASSRSTLQARANEEMEWARLHRQEVFDAYARLRESRDGNLGCL